MKIDQDALKQQVESILELVYNHNKSTKSSTSFTPEQIKIIVLSLLLDKSSEKILENIQTNNTVENLLVEQTYSEDTLKPRYRALSLLFHPDKMNSKINILEKIIKQHGKDILFQSLQFVYNQLTAKQKTPLSKSIQTFEPFFDTFSASEICEILGGASMPNFETDTGREILSLLVTIQQQEEHLASNANYDILEKQASKEYLDLMKLLIQYSFTTNKIQLAYGEKASLAGQIISMTTYLTLLSTSPLGIITDVSLYGSIMLMLIAKGIKGICHSIDTSGLFKTLLDTICAHLTSVDRIAYITCQKQVQCIIKLQIRALEACSPGFEILKNMPAFLDSFKWPDLPFGSTPQKTTAPTDPFLLIEWPQHAQPFEHKLKENEEFYGLVEIQPVSLEEGWVKLPDTPLKNTM